MSLLPRGHRRDRREVAAEIGDWVSVDADSLDSDDAAKYLKRSSAISLYASGQSLDAIRAETGIGSKELYRFLDRCHADHADGRPWGWRALLPRTHVFLRSSGTVSENERRGYANLFTEFLKRFPAIRDNLLSLSRSGLRVGEKGVKRALSIRKITQKMHEDCRQAGLTINEYPLSVENGAYGSVRLFVNSVRQQHAGGKLPAGGLSDLSTVTHCYQRAEADGHWKDLICTVEMPSPTSRGVYYLPIERLWLVPVIESHSTAVLGYSIAYGRNYSGADLVQAVRASIVPWTPKDGLSYSVGGGFPSGIDGLAFICVDELLLDNHRGHLSIETVGQLHKTLGATPVYGSIDNQNCRACAEGFFNQIETVLRELPSSTGSSPKDKPVLDPTANAVKYGITDERIQEIAEQTIAKYNSGKPPGSSLSRIEILQRYVNDPRSLVRRIPIAQRQEIGLYDIVLELVIRGNEAQGVRPHVYWLESRYTNPVIASNYALIGMKIKAYAFANDIRKLKAFFSSGADAGELLCERRFRGTPHSVTTRKHANASRRTGGHKSDSSGDDIGAFTSSLVQKAPKSKAAATELARIKAEQRALAAARGGDQLAECGSGLSCEANSCKPEVSQEGTWAEKLKTIRTQF